MGRNVKTRVFDIRGVQTSKDHDDQEVRDKDSTQKAKSKKYLDKKRRARVTEFKAGDSVIVKQDKTTTRPPWEIRPYSVEEVHGTKLYLLRDGKTKVRSVDKCKLVKLPVPASPEIKKVSVKGRV